MSHPLLRSLASDFSGAIRRRGEEYYRAARVRLAEIDPGNPGRVLAFVQGARRYTVEIGFEDLEAAYSCTCPYFFDRELPCKHIWATFLKLEAGGFFSRLAEERSPKRPGTVPVQEPGGVSLTGPGAAGRPDRTAGGSPAGPDAAWPPAGGGRSFPALPEWKLELGRVREAGGAARSAWPPDREILYVFDVPRTQAGGRPAVHLYYREPQGRARPVPGSGFRLYDLWQLSDPRDREILGVLRGGSYQNVYDEEAFGYRLLGQEAHLLCSSYLLDRDLVQLLLPRMAETGRLFLRMPSRTVGRARGGGGDESFRDERIRDRGATGAPLREDPFAAGEAVVPEGGAPWELHLVLAALENGRRIRLEGMLKREGQSMSLVEPQLMLKGGVMFARGRLCRHSCDGCFGWVGVLRRSRHLSAPAGQLAAFLDEILSFPDLPPLQIDPSVGIGTIEGDPQPMLRVIKADRLRNSPTGGGLIGELSFLYQGREVSAPAERPGSFLEEERMLILRDRPAERGALARLLELGFRHVYEYRSRCKVLKLAARRLPGVVERLLQEGWQVEAEGKLLRSAAAVSVHVATGIDWFEVRGGVRFGELEVGLPELLKSLRRGANRVRLGDGSYGVLPEQWLKQQGFLLELGEIQPDHLRFRSSQALLIELLLQAQPESDCDQMFSHLRERINRYTGIEPLDAPPGFVGVLRGYQREGLGWFDFLDEFGFGGCLADDMGLGKTVQVLAQLERRRSGLPARGGGKQSKRSASLVVVPKSLVFNWQQEARRFTPGLRILDHTGSGRPRGVGSFGRYDAVLTTYGTMRNDIELLKAYAFDYIVLDEAQIIKNAGSLTAKAARLLQGRRRLALSGTPIENHLGELWSLFEFLNPGMLGGVSFFRKHIRSRQNLGEGARKLLARYLRPFILRRTKEQVAPELPDKVEQTLFCTLETAERRRYDELKRYYQRALNERIESGGLGKAKIQVLEALLRLRQAACHPGLLDRRSLGRPSAKLDLLIQQLRDVVAEERKALVFSQFTSLLKILASWLEQEDLAFEYLDGRTRDRQRRVQRFQEEPECRLFLISLKAGGLGLNLTAAEYVFLLDPWWNPASEAQAIDRTHRIGQQKKVFAYRLIARDTVEEKVLELQQTKRDLAEAIISQDNRLIGELSREDLALLLS